MKNKQILRFGCLALITMISGGSLAGLSKVKVENLDVPLTIEKGQTIEVGALFKNYGATKVAPFMAGIFLSPTIKVNTHVDQLIGEVKIASGMSPHQEFYIHELVSIPNDVASGSYYVGVIPNLQAAFSATRTKLASSSYALGSVIANHFPSPYYPSGSGSDFSTMKGNPPSEFLIGFFQILGRGCDTNKVTTDGTLVYNPITNDPSIRDRTSAGLSVGASIGGALGPNNSSIFEVCSEEQIKTIIRTLANAKISEIDFDIEGTEFGHDGEPSHANYGEYLTIMKWVKTSYPDIRMSFTFPVYSYYWKNGWTDAFKAFLQEADRLGLASSYRIMVIGVGGNDGLKKYWDDSISHLPTINKTSLYAVIDPWNHSDATLTPRDAFNFLSVVQKNRGSGLTFNGLNQDTHFIWYNCLLENIEAVCPTIRP